VKTFKRAETKSACEAAGKNQRPLAANEALAELKIGVSEGPGLQLADDSLVALNLSHGREKEVTRQTPQ
jgi:hypothetical protein